MVRTEGRAAPEAPGAGFREGHVEADGFRVCYMQAGDGAPLVYLHGGGGLQLTRTHELLAQRFHVIAFEMPGFGASPENTRTGSLSELAATMAAAASGAGLDSFNLWGTSFGSGIALRLALQAAERVSALVLESPAALRPEGNQASQAPPPSSAEELARRLYAHPERVGFRPEFDPAVRAKIRTLLSRLQGAEREGALRERLPGLSTPTLVLFGTEDRMIPPEMGRVYKELIPNCSLVFVYDAGHEIGADRPEAVAEVAGDFLDRHERFIISRRDSLLLP